MVLTRSMMLGGIVFGAVTGVTRGSVSTRNRGIISLLVVILYALLDYFVGFFGIVRRFFCSVACGCTPSDAPSVSMFDMSPSTGTGFGFDLKKRLGLGSFELDLSSDSDDSSLDSEELSAEVEEAIKSLDQPIAAPDALAAAPKEAAAQEDPPVTETPPVTEAHNVADPVPAETTEGFISYGRW